MPAPTAVADARGTTLTPRSAKDAQQRGLSLEGLIENVLRMEAPESTFHVAPNPEPKTRTPQTQKPQNRTSKSQASRSMAQSVQCC